MDNDQNDGISEDDLQKIQTTQSEVTSDPVLRPSEIAGATNEPCLSNAELTSAVRDLQRRFNNMNYEDHGGRY